MVLLRTPGTVRRVGTACSRLDDAGSGGNAIVLAETAKATAVNGRHGRTGNAIPFSCSAGKIPASPIRAVSAATLVNPIEVLNESMFARNDPAGRDVQHVCYFQYLMEGYGLSATQAANFFKNDTIITMGLQGNATLVNFASIIYGTRFVGD